MKQCMGLYAYIGFNWSVVLPRSTLLSTSPWTAAAEWSRPPAEAHRWPF